MFNFRIIETPNGTVVDLTLKTPVESITVTKLAEYEAEEKKLKQVRIQQWKATRKSGIM